MNATLTILRRDPGRDLWTAHYPSCPDAPHAHYLLVPWPERPDGQVNLQTQAGFTLHGMEKLAVHWDKPWFLTVVH